MREKEMMRETQEVQAIEEEPVDSFLFFLLLSQPDVLPLEVLFNLRRQVQHGKEGEFVLLL